MSVQSMTQMEQQTLEILTKLSDNNKSFVLDFAKFIEQKQVSEKNARNAAYIKKIQSGIDQCSEGRGIAHDIVEIPEYE